MLVNDVQHLLLKSIAPSSWKANLQNTSRKDYISATAVIWRLNQWRQWRPAATWAVQTGGQPVYQLLWMYASILQTMCPVWGCLMWNIQLAGSAEGPEVPRAGALFVEARGWGPDAPGEGTGPGASKSTPVPTKGCWGAGARLFSLGYCGRARAWHWETSPQE